MKLVTISFKVLLICCAVCSVGSAFATTTTKIASTNYVDDKINTENNQVVIKNATNPVTLSSNSQTTTTGVSTSSTEVTTVGWTDSNRTSKVRSGGQTGTSLVDVWIE